MPRYAGQNLANFDSKSGRMDSPGTQRRRHNFGKQVLVASGNKIVGDGLCLRLLPTYDVDATGARQVDSSGAPVLSPFGQTMFFDDGTQGQGFGDWQRMYECVHFLGHPGVSFIVWDGNVDVSKWESPAWLLFKASSDIRKADIGGDIGRLFADLRNSKDGFGANSHVGSLKAPQPFLFISGSQMTVRPDGSIGLAVYEEQERNARIFGLTKTAMQSFYNALKVKVNADVENSDLLCGDLVATDAAKLVTIMPTGYGRGQRLPKPSAISTEGPEYVFVPSYAAPVAPNEVVVLGKPNPTGHADGGKSHSVVLHDNFMQHQIDLHEYDQQINNENVTFDEMMYVPSFEEQAEIMADVFPREALEYAWHDYSSYLSALPTGRTTVQAPQVRQEQAQSQQRPAPSRPAPPPARAPVSLDEVEAADDIDIAPIPAGATIPPPAASAALAAAKAKARAAQKRA